MTMSDTASKYSFLFGMPLLPAHHRGSGNKRVFILGAYPSALHIRWISPNPGISIGAIAVDNEPEPFWTGVDEQERIQAWKAKVSWKPAWGEALPCGNFNGSSGKWIEDNVLRPLSIPRDDAWITDCLDTYRISKKAAARLAEPAVISVIELHSIPPALLPAHPGEVEIVAEALEQHRERLLKEINESSPGLIITLGNAALRVVRALAKEVAKGCPKQLSAHPADYGKMYAITLENSSPLNLLPLAHPAAPAEYQDTHYARISSVGSEDRYTA